MQTSPTLGQKASKVHKVTATDQIGSLTSPPKTALRNVHAVSTPAQYHPLYLHRIAVPLMYDTIKTIGQKASNIHKETATDQTDSLTNQPKTVLWNNHAVSTPAQ